MATIKELHENILQLITAQGRLDPKKFYEDDDDDKGYIDQIIKEIEALPSTIGSTDCKLNLEQAAYIGKLKNPGADLFDGLDDLKKWYDEDVAKGIDYSTAPPTDTAQPAPANIAQAAPAQNVVNPPANQPPPANAPVNPPGTGATNAGTQAPPAGTPSGPSTTQQEKSSIEKIGEGLVDIDTKEGQKKVVTAALEMATQSVAGKAEVKEDLHAFKEEKSEESINHLKEQLQEKKQELKEQKKTTANIGIAFALYFAITLMFGMWYVL